MTRIILQSECPRLRRSIETFSATYLGNSWKQDLEKLGELGQEDTWYIEEALEFLDTAESVLDLVGLGYESRIWAGSFRAYLRELLRYIGYEEET